MEERKKPQEAPHLHAQKRRRKQRGFTLLEVILVALMIALIAGVVYKKVLNKGTQTAKVSALSGVVENVIDAISQFAAANGCMAQLQNCGGLFADTTTDYAPNLVTQKFLADESTPFATDGIDVKLAGTTAPANRVALVTLRIGDATLASQAYNSLTSTYQASNIYFCDPGGTGTDLNFFFVPPTIPPVDLTTMTCP